LDRNLFLPNNLFLWHNLFFPNNLLFPISRPSTLVVTKKEGGRRKK
jgi:hypothetical protein